MSNQDHAGDALQINDPRSREYSSDFLCRIHQPLTFINHSHSFTTRLFIHCNLWVHHSGSAGSAGSGSAGSTGREQTWSEVHPWDEVDWFYIWGCPAPKNSWDTGTNHHKSPLITINHVASTSLNHWHPSVVVWNILDLYDMPSNKSNILSLVILFSPSRRVSFSRGKFKKKLPLAYDWKESVSFIHHDFLAISSILVPRGVPWVQFPKPPRLALLMAHLPASSGRCPGRSMEIHGDPLVPWEWPWDNLGKNKTCPFWKADLDRTW